MSPSSPSRSPMTRTFTLLLWSSARSCRMNRRNSPISSRISARGRSQFSELNEKMVRTPMPSSPAARTVLRSASTPRRWPSLRGRPRAAAQRPLPSMMMATCRGAPNAAVGAVVGASASDIDVEGVSPAPSHRENFSFLGGQRLVDFGNGQVGRLLDVAVMALVIVLADLVILFQLLENVHAVAPHVAHGDARGFRIFVRDLDELLAPLLVELGDAQADCLPVGRGSEPEIGGADRLFDRVHLDRKSVV